MIESKFTFQFFNQEKHVGTMWVDELRYEPSENVFVGLCGKDRRWFIMREGITHIRRLKGQR